MKLISKPELCGRVVEKGDTVSIHYIGTTEDGEKFDSSYDRNEPFKFTIGAGAVIKAFEEGVLGMCVGETRRMISPPETRFGFEEIIPEARSLREFYPKTKIYFIDL